MERVVYTHLGSSSARVKVGPGIGLDNGVVSIGRGRVMILTTDPVSYIPPVGAKLSAWLSVHLVASDFTASGVDPELAAFTYNFPPQMSEGGREEYLRAIGNECKRLGVSIAAGHTGAYPGGGYTVIGSGTMIGFAEEGGYVTPQMAKAGDRILMTKHAAIEAAASLAFSFPEYVESKVGPDLASRARSLVNLCTTVEDARVAKRVGLGANGVTSMHDATEGGILGALGEMARASGTAFEVDAGKIRTTPEAGAVCAAFGLDPLATMGEGSLLLTCIPRMVPPLTRNLSRARIGVQEIGEVKEGRGLVTRRGSVKLRASRLGRDLYWTAYQDAVRKELR